MENNPAASSAADKAVGGTTALVTVAVVIVAVATAEGTEVVGVALAEPRTAFGLLLSQVVGAVVEKESALGSGEAETLQGTGDYL